MNAIDALALLNTLDESERLEAKRGSEIGQSVLETICAFANEPGLQGGTLLLGIARDESDLFSPYSVVGVDQPDPLAAALATQCREQFNVPVRVQIASEQVSGRTVLVVTVPEAQPGDKPVFLKKSLVCREAPTVASAVQTNSAPRTIFRCCIRDGRSRVSTAPRCRMRCWTTSPPRPSPTIAVPVPRPMPMPRNCAGAMTNCSKRSAACVVPVRAACRRSPASC
jgi:predicted HTH transcriptional regulator